MSATGLTHNVQFGATLLQPRQRVDLLRRGIITPLPQHLRCVSACNCGRKFTLSCVLRPSSINLPTFFFYIYSPFTHSFFELCTYFYVCCEFSFLEFLLQVVSHFLIPCSRFYVSSLFRFYVFLLRYFLLRPHFMFQFSTTFSKLSSSEFQFYFFSHVHFILLFILVSSSLFLCSRQPVRGLPEHEPGADGDAPTLPG